MLTTPKLIDGSYNLYDVNTAKSYDAQRLGNDMMDPIKTIGFTLAAFARPSFGRSRMERYQWTTLKRLVEHAARIPFYREWFDQHGFHPRDLRQPNDLHRIPLMGKQQLHELRQTFSDEAVARAHLIEHKTSGSTGAPIRVLRSPAEERRLNMLRWRFHSMLGLRLGDRHAWVKTTWEPLTRRFNRLQDLSRSFRLLDVRVFDCFADPADNYRRLVEFQPHVLAGYPGALVRIALQHDPAQNAMHSLRRISCGGEALAPSQRRLLEERFAVPVYDVYGATEGSLLAWECPKTGHYHVNDDGVLLEVCRDGRRVQEGESGDIVITSLHSRTMPIIRYTMGDRAVAGPSRCPCGSPFSTIRELKGRIIDFLPLPDGRELHPFELLNEIVTESGDWVTEYQFVQEALDCFRLQIVPRRPVSESETAAFRAALMIKLGDASHLTIEMVNHVPLAESGKLHFCRSAVR